MTMSPTVQPSYAVSRSINTVTTWNPSESSVGAIHLCGWSIAVKSRTYAGAYS
ncbi:hypothetical protein FPSE_06570 [Fusarium pseudograminearum CS3096]|uniref:Uncharacterized protein n=1 Tax=Fusarium pseudograminearum (strain CS3096) TaxID=1028729 RepID=K3W004_FUSPC|nr:hypothetical protein FPSE_06570 [Fusarium pseudograminearum CS3096]EKJ73305.1 hypothetical protein FPSE_06570 [Fusarium pseudograminearum CS3096]